MGGCSGKDVFLGGIICLQAPQLLISRPSLPPRVSSSFGILSALKYLDLSGNILTGKIELPLCIYYSKSGESTDSREPQNIPNQAVPFFALTSMLLSPHPRCAGTLPSNLCEQGRKSPLIDLVIGGNQLTGLLNISTCGNLFFIDATVSVLSCCLA